MPEYGDTENTRSWSNARVLVAFPDGSGDYPALPATTEDEFPAGWELVGLLDGGQGFTEATSETVTETQAWGNILISRMVSDQSTTKTFTAYEINETTDRLRHIEDDGGTLKQFRRPAERVKVAFEKLDGSKAVTERQITANTAEIAINGDMTETETTPAVLPFIATIFPDSDLSLFVIQRTAEVGS